MASPNKKHNRCKWASSHELLTDYHDTEWGEPVHDDRLLFEMLNLEGAQAGLSWLTVLKKRSSYRRAFDRFDAKKIAQYGPDKVKALLADEGIVRNRLKIQAVIANAKAYLEVKKEFGSFDHYIWGFSEGKSVHPSVAEIVSLQMSKDLKRRGFRFVGPTICYAFMQAVGILNDHAPDCFRRRSAGKGR